MPMKSCALFCFAIFIAAANGCHAEGNKTSAAASANAMSPVASSTPQVTDESLVPGNYGGFDGKRALEHVSKQVGFGPHPSGSPAIAQVQSYILEELKSYGCAVESDDFSADTPVGRLTMKNILVKVPGEKPNIILLGTHYDTLRQENFVGADDGGSSTGVMLELAKMLCSQHGRYAVWIAFFDGEEAMKQWSELDSRYGSRQMAARFAASGDIGRIKAFLLADLVGARSLHFSRESSSTQSLVDLVWSTAAKLGYSNVFINASAGAEDDHDPFLKRKVPSVDVIGFDRTNDVPFWHTTEDTLDKLSARSLAITGHVFIESVKQLQLK